VGQDEDDLFRLELNSRQNPVSGVSLLDKGTNNSFILKGIDSNESINFELWPWFPYGRSDI
jgi:hypothetical protein